MMTPKVGNLWNVGSLYDLRYYNCPSCPYKHVSKQDFACHAFDTHPESVIFLRKIIDGSLDDIYCPWESNDYKIEEVDENFSGYIKTEIDDTDYAEDLADQWNHTDDVVNDKFNHIIEDAKNQSNCDNFKRDFQGGIEGADYLDLSNEPEKKEEGTLIDGQVKLSKHKEVFHKCESCGKSFTQGYSLKKHIHTIHEGHKDHKCEYCSKSFTHAHHLKRHIHIVHEEHKDYKCEYCSKAFALEQNLKKHIQAVHEGYTYNKPVKPQTDLDDYWDDNKSDPLVEKTDKIENTRISNFAEINSNFEIDFEDGIRSVDSLELSNEKEKKKEGTFIKSQVKLPKNKDKVFHKCESCGKSFSIAYLLKKHIHTVHEGRKDYKCEFCGNSFAHAHHLKRHIHRVHEDYEGIKDYSSGKSYMKKHNLTSYVCDSCGKSFTTSGYLKTHIYTIHEGHKDHKCVICGKSFSQGYTLKGHIRTVHEGHKDYTCDSCGKSFTQEISMKSHIRTVHDGHRDFNCSECGKSFATASYLKKHIRIIHEGQKNKCEFCGKSYTGTENLKRHIYTVHEGNKQKNYNKKK